MTFTAAPCKDCTDRRLGCHSVCPVWADWKAGEDAKNAAVRKQMNAESAFWDGSERQRINYNRELHKRMVRGH